ncbi:MAG: protein-glutamate O-methyltransferase CheR [Pirellulales bacterium]|nr:protein-glutamate O-methyltransferase CheR [Pirellulales bacterium]
MILEKAPYPSPPSARSDTITDAQLHRFAEMIYRRCGVRIPPRKRLLLSNRLRRRLRQTGVKDFSRYYGFLRRLPADDPEWDAFVQEVTTHETYLFRDEVQWKWFREEFLPDRAAAARRGRAPRTLRIWSAGCSTGDEPASAACCIADVLPDHRRWRIRLLGTDVAHGALEKAAAASFDRRAMRLVPEAYRRRFFKKTGDGAWKLKPAPAEMIEYRRRNLMEPLDEGGFDLVLLRNVLIYFDAESKAAAVRNVRAALGPGGHLMTGAAEGVAHLLRDVERLKPWLVRLPRE